MRPSSSLRPDVPLGAEAAARLAAFAAPAPRPRAGRPASSGEREFWGLPFALSPETLVPRPDTETVVETALRLLPDRQAPLRILDLGTGSGCLLVALLHELPRATGLGDRPLARGARDGPRQCGRATVSAAAPPSSPRDWADGALRPAST